MFNENTSDFKWLVGQFIDIIDVFVLFIFAITFVVLAWKIVSTWIIGGGDATKVEEGKNVVLVGVIVLVVMASIWGIVALLKSSIF
jgi:hypothetical protein